MKQYIQAARMLPKTHPKLYTALAWTGYAILFVMPGGFVTLAALAWWKKTRGQKKQPVMYGCCPQI